MSEEGDSGSSVIASKLICILAVAATILAASSLGRTERPGGAAIPSRPRVMLDAGRVAGEGAAVDAPRSGGGVTGSEWAPDAAIAGDDYPPAWKREPRDAFATVFGNNRECVSFVAWRIYRASGGRKVPADRNPPPDWAIYSINVEAGWGNAGNWAAFAVAHGIRTDQHPTVGSVAQWNVATAVGIEVGHVAIVKAVDRDGSIDLEQYNLREDGRYSVLHMAKDAATVDRSNGHEPWTVPWPDNFIHIHGR